MATNSSKTKTKEKGLGTNSVIVLAVIVAVIAVGAFLTTEKTLFKAIGKNSRVINKKRDADNTLAQNYKNLDGLSNQYNQLGDLNKVIKDSLPDTADFPSIVATMEAVAGSSGIKLLSVSPASSTATASSSSTTAPATTSSPSSAVQSINGTTSSSSSTTASTGSSDKPQEYDFSVQVNGTYTNVMLFVTKLQLSARPFRISAIKMNGVTTSVDSTMTIATFYYKPQPLNYKTEDVQ